MTNEFDFLILLPNDSDDLGLGLPVGRWRSPEKVKLICGAQPGDDFLEFLYRDSAPYGRSLAPSPRPVLAQFVEIARGDEQEDSNRLTGYPAKALTFARRYGNLGVCGIHNLPCWHTDPPCPSLFERRRGVVRVSDRLAAWYTYSRLARAILNLVAKPNSPRSPFRL